MTSPSQVASLEAVSARLEHADPQEIIGYALETYGPSTTISFSGAEDVAVIDIASRLDRPFRVITLDTGRLHPETYRFIEQVRNHYGVRIETFFPQPQAVEELVRDKGLFSFFRDGHTECCAIRKVEPLGRALAGVSAYLTGQRQDQSPATRGLLPVLQEDAAHRASDGSPLAKFNPLSYWSSADLWSYIREHGAPHNELHDRGFRSIGCEPCTMVTNPGQHEREGRWWWEEATQRECGIHIAPDRES